MWYMNQMVHSAMTASQPRDRLLAAAVEQAMQGGIADLSLRELAAAIGTSHRMLLYHFGSREGLLVAVARAVEEAERARFLSWGMTAEDARRIWARLSDPALWPAERLFFELYVQGLLGRLGDERSWTALSRAGSRRSPRPWSTPGPARRPRMSTPGSGWPWSAACSSTCWPPAIVTG